MSAVIDQAVLSPLAGHPGRLIASLPAAARIAGYDLDLLPYALRALADGLLRQCPNAKSVIWTVSTRGALLSWRPERILMQDSSGIPVLADLAGLQELHSGFEPTLPAHLVVDHSVEVDDWRTADAADRNVRREFERNGRRYRFLRWMDSRQPWLTVFPPGSGICHQLNLERIATLVVEDGGGVIGLDSVIGTDSHTPMINALGVPGWGVGGIEALSVILGNPLEMRVPAVLGVRLAGKLPTGCSAADAALSLTALLRTRMLAGTIVEFCGPGLAGLSVPDRATIANMSPEYGSTMSYFPADEQTLAFLKATGRSQRQISLCRAYLEAQRLFRNGQPSEPVFDDVVEFDLSALQRVVAGPSRPQDKLTLGEVPASAPPAASTGLDNGSVVIAAITSCTNTSNPRAMAAAGLVAKAAVGRGLQLEPWVKASLAPGSKAAAGLLARSGLQDSLDSLGFRLVGFGCTTCMGNSGPLEEWVSDAIHSRDLAVAAVLSGNRNFAGRIHPSCRLAYLCAPALVVAYALAGTMHIDLGSQPVGKDQHGRPVFLDDLYPAEAEIDALVASASAPGTEDSSEIDRAWDAIPYGDAETYEWEGESGFMRRPPFVDAAFRQPLVAGDILGARALLSLGDNVTTDHISPVSRIGIDSSAGRWLAEHGVDPSGFGSFSARRNNHDVMLRGGFANPRLENHLSPREGGWTRRTRDGPMMRVDELAARYRDQNIPMIVLAGANYGAGSARDWAAKVTRLLGVRAVLAESFERIHRSNLVAMGILPVAIAREARLSLDGWEEFDILGLSRGIRPDMALEVRVQDRSGVRVLRATARVETELEAAWIGSGGVLAHVLLDRIATSTHACSQPQGGTDERS